MKPSRVVLYAALLWIGTVSGCAVGPAPLEEFTLARTALEAAQAVEASRFSPGFFHQAEESFRKARLLFGNREYEAARQEFKKAQIAAEKAENSARLIRMRTGEF